MLKILDKVLGVGGFLNGEKTIIGAVLMGSAYIGQMFPTLQMDIILDVVSNIGDLLFSWGLVHWKIKDLIKK